MSSSNTDKTFARLAYEPRRSEQVTLARDLTPQLGAKASQLANRTDCEVLVVVRPKGFVFTAPPTIFYSENMTSDPKSMNQFLDECAAAPGAVTISTKPEHYRHLGVSGLSFKKQFGTKNRCAIPRSSQRRSKDGDYAGFSLPRPQSSNEGADGGAEAPQLSTQDMEQNMEIFRRLQQVQQSIMEEIDNHSTRSPRLSALLA